MKPYQKRFASAAALAWLLLTGAHARTRTSAAGAKTFEGELRSYDAAAGKVTATLPNGIAMSFMQDKLSADDIAFVKENASKLPPSGAVGKSSLGTITADPKELFKKHDDKPAEMSKPVRVFILLGQSNMVGLGNIRTLEEAVKSKSKYPYLIDEGGRWTQRKDVHNVFVMCSGRRPASVQHNDWMSVSNRKELGPEHGIGHALGNAIDTPVMKRLSAEPK